MCLYICEKEMQFLEQIVSVEFKGLNDFYEESETISTVIKKILNPIVSRMQSAQSGR